MPLGKYYCDYCDKQFQDTYFARKRHLQGIQHLRAKALWYDSLNETNQTYPDGFPKGVCSRFVKTGFCPFGDSCKYLHPKNNPPQNSGNQGLRGDMMRDSMGMSWGNLPPSLKPPPEGGYPLLPFVDWG
ncbi:C3H1-type domain-containing protein [Citrus sinensis]|uniref:zinc finger CCCH domain-containing protein 3 isoform X2 n=1 Tax=Citrus sinensis TaxID=2711 RepID=UPI0007635C9F|nr:zinc finger CCCH domain-containing protein 3 isoform X2 [Citrus sinensis]KAH9670421.1 C3H1-type domain-containing protein [Citrus sinensis]